MKAFPGPKDLLAFRHRQLPTDRSFLRPSKPRVSGSLEHIFYIMLYDSFMIDEGKYLSHEATDFRGELQVVIWEVEVGRKVPHGFRTVHAEGPVHERLCKGIPHCIRFDNFYRSQRLDLMRPKKKFW